jgi:ApbE superfamily uncharacterized protein (UPF0280 family)
MNAASHPRTQIAMLPDQRRLHLQDGPIDLIVEAYGSPDEIRAAYVAASERFVLVLDELCEELPLLRQPAHPASSVPRGTVAQRMMRAVQPLSERNFITPMAAVAGSVAEEILLAMVNSANLTRAYVNNGGDIALHLTPGERFTAGAMETKPGKVPNLFATTTMDASSPVRGIATSGWPGRSFSLGIADAVTVLANTASMADAAATIIANAVDLPGHPNIVRVRARDLAPDSDLGDLFVTQHVGPLSPQEILSALDAGSRVAEDLASRGLIHSAALHLRKQTRVVTLNLFVHPAMSGELLHA